MRVLDQGHQLVTEELEREVARRRREAHGGRPVARERLERVEQPHGPEEVHVDDPPGVGHRRRQPGGVGQCTERAELADPIGQRRHRVGIADVAGDADGAVDAGVAQVDGDEVVDRRAQAVDAGTAHPAPRAGDDAHRHGVIPMRATGSAGAWRA